MTAAFSYSYGNRLLAETGKIYAWFAVDRGACSPLRALNSNDFQPDFVSMACFILEVLRKAGKSSLRLAANRPKNGSFRRRGLPRRDWGEIGSA